MKTLSRFESNLLRILHCFLGHAPISQVLTEIVRPARRPNCLSRDAVQLVEQSLANGTVMLLTRGGAWKQQQHLRGDEIQTGSLWQRSRPEELGMEFSPASLEFLIWLTSADASGRLEHWKPPPLGELSIGDQYLIYRAAITLRETALMTHWYREPLFRENPLIALMLTQQFVESRSIPDVNFDAWMTGSGSIVMEAMQDDLARSWIELERQKGRIAEADLMRQMGEAQHAVLDPLLKAAERHGRRDLVRFLLEAFQQLLDAGSRSEHWTSNLNLAGLRLAERTEVYRSASVLLRVATRLRQWHTASLDVRFFDEEYAESQLWKSMWESTEAATSVDHAERVLSQLSF